MGDVKIELVPNYKFTENIPKFSHLFLLMLLKSLGETWLDGESEKVEALKKRVRPRPRARFPVVAK